MRGMMLRGHLVAVALALLATLFRATGSNGFRGTAAVSQLESTTAAQLATSSANTTRSLQISSTAIWPKIMGNVANTGFLNRQAVIPAPFVQWRATAPGIIASSPVIAADGSVILGCNNGFVYAFLERPQANWPAVPNSFTTIWQFRTGGFITATPLIGADGTVYVGSYDSNMYAITPPTTPTTETQNAVQRWVFTAGGRIQSSATIDTMNNLYFGCDDSNVYSVNGNTGARRWTFMTGRMILSVPTLNPDQSRVYIGSNDANLYSLNTETGSRVWRFITGDGIQGGITLGNDNSLYFGSMDGFVYCVTQDGMLKWSRTTSTTNWMTSAPALDANQNVYAGGQDGVVYSFNQGGSLRWQSQVGLSSLVASPTLTNNGVLYIGNTDNFFYQVSMATGSIIWSLPTSNEIKTTAAIDLNGRVYFASTDYTMRVLVAPPPTAQPTPLPTARPSLQPTNSPTVSPTVSPTPAPTTLMPTPTPSVVPTPRPSPLPTVEPTESPTTMQPTPQPSAVPTERPTTVPTPEPSPRPTTVPTPQPSQVPTPEPSPRPTTLPTARPTARPTASPTDSPTRSPTLDPTSGPTDRTLAPTNSPTRRPTASPTLAPSPEPTPEPSARPSTEPTPAPTRNPSPEPSRGPTRQPSAGPTRIPSAEPSLGPTRPPTPAPTRPSAAPTPTPEPSFAPSWRPSPEPSFGPTRNPTPEPSWRPSAEPTTAMPSPEPTVQPTTPFPTWLPGQFLERVAGAQAAMQPGRCAVGTAVTNPSNWQISANRVIFPGLFGPNKDWWLRVEYYMTGLAMRVNNQSVALGPINQQFIDTAIQWTANGTTQLTYLNTDGGSEYIQSANCGCPPAARLQGRCNPGFPTPDKVVVISNFRIPKNSPFIMSNDGGSITLVSHTTGWCAAFCPVQGLFDLYVRYMLSGDKQLPLVPTTEPTYSPMPSALPSARPTPRPTPRPSGQPTGQPTRQPTQRPSRQPTRQPTQQPTRQPSRQPTRQPTQQPTAQPTRRPTRPRPTPRPTVRPTSVPTVATPRPTTRRPTPEPTTEPTPRPSTLRPSPNPTTFWPTPVPTTLFPTPTNILSSSLSQVTTYFTVTLQLTFPGNFGSPSSIATPFGQQVITSAIRAVINNPVPVPQGSPPIVGLNAQGVEIRDLQVVVTPSVLQEQEQERRELQQSRTTKTTRKPTLQPSPAPTPTFFQMPQSSFNVTFELLPTSGGSALTTSMFGPLTQSAIIVANALDAVIPIPSIRTTTNGLGSNITFVSAQPVPCSSGTGASCGVSLTYQISFSWGQAVSAGYSQCAAGSSACATYIQTLLTNSMLPSCTPTTQTSGGPRVLLPCFVSSLLTTPGVSGKGTTSGSPLASVGSAIWGVSSPVNNVFPATSAPGSAPTPEPTPRVTNRVRMVPSPAPTLSAGDTMVVTISFTVMFNWGLARCLNPALFPAPLTNCFTMLKQLIATAITNGMLIHFLRQFATQLNTLGSLQPSFTWGTNVVGTDLVTISPLITDMLTTPPTVRPTFLVTGTRPPVAQLATDAVTQSNVSIMRQLPLIGGVVGGCVVILLLLAFYMYKVRQQKTLVIEEYGRGDDDTHNDPMSIEHQQALDAYQQQRDEDEFRERESGGVDVLYNPALAGGRPGGFGGGGFGYYGDEGSVVSGFAPPPLSIPAKRRITLQRPGAGAGAGVQMHQAHEVVQPPLPPARRITIIAKPPLGGDYPSPGGGSPGASSRKAHSIHIGAAAAPPVGSMRPINRGDSPHNDL